MPTYTYKARNDGGKAITGTMDAASEEELMNRLQRLSYTPISIAENRQGSSRGSQNRGLFSQKIKSQDIIIFNMQLGSMTVAGITLLSALNIISKQIYNEKFRKIVEKVKEDVAGGSSFSEALSRHPRVFSSLYLSMVRAGETGGKLNDVLTRLAIYLEQQEELKQKIKGALVYPMILLVAGILVILLIVTFVMPKFVVIFNKAGIALPLPTQILYAFGVGLKKFWYLIILVFMSIVMGVKSYARSAKGKFRFDQFVLKIPVIGPVIRKVIVARFCRTLATLVSSGVSMLQSLDIMRDVVGSEVFARAVSQARKSVERGERLDQPLKMSGEFPDDAVHMISVGEETGNLGQMLSKIADFYDVSMGYKIRKLTTLIEPIFISVMGVMVGFIMASMLLPLFDMVKTIQR